MWPFRRTLPWAAVCNMARKKRRRSRSAREQSLTSQPNSVPLSASEAKEDIDAKIEEEKQGKPSTLSRAIRLTGLAPIALLVASLALHNLWPWSIPHWFQPIIDNEVAVLTLSAGHAGIIGLLINNRGRFTSSTYALFIAATATALAGLRTIGESTPGVVIAMMLFLLTVPAVWAETLSVKTQQAWVFVRSRSGISIILLLISLVWIAYNESRYEDYIKNWILIPLGILAGIILGAFVIWLLLKLIYKCVLKLRSRVATANRRVARRKGRGH